MRRSSIFVVVCSIVCLALAANLSAQDEKKKKRKKRGGAQVTNNILRPFNKANLTEEQTAKVKEMLKGKMESLVALQRDANTVLSAEQRKARQAAVKEARQKGLKGKKANEFVMEKMELDKETIDKMKASSKKLNDARIEIQKSIYAMLTDEQKATVKNRRIKQSNQKKKKKIDD